MALLSPSTPPGGISGFLFDIDAEQSVDFESDVSDHLLEDNTPVQDHIATKAETVTLRGLVAEVVQYRKEGRALPTPEPKLPITPGTKIDVAAGEERIRAAAAAQSNFFVQKASALAANSLYGYYLARSPQKAGQTRQALVAGYFYQLWRGRVLCTVDTPFGLFTNMAIQSVKMAQGSKTLWASDFTVVLKRLRQAPALKRREGLLAGAAVYSRAPIANNGSLAQKLATSAEFEGLLAKAPKS